MYADRVPDSVAQFEARGQEPLSPLLLNTRLEAHAYTALEQAEHIQNLAPLRHAGSLDMLCKQQQLQHLLVVDAADACWHGEGPADDHT